METREKLRTESLNLLRFPLAIVVLSIHVFHTEGLTVQGQEYTFDQMPLFLEINYCIDAFLRGKSVPIYFFISGYVFFLGITLTREVFRRKLRNRVNTLFIPFLFWNTLAILFTLLAYLPCFATLFPHLKETRLDFSFSHVLYSYWDGLKGIFMAPEMPETIDSIYPHNVPLWFLRDLMIVVLCTPVINLVLRHTRHYAICLLGLAWFVMAHWELRHLNQLCTAFFFFSWGAYMSINRKDMLVEFGRFRRSSVIVYVALALLYIASAHFWPEACLTIKLLNTFVGLLFAYNVAAWLLERGICRPNAFLASSSFFIYVAHYALCMNMLKVLFLVVRPTSSLTMLAIYLLTIAITAGSLIFVFWLLRRYMPGVLKVITGRK